MARDTAISGRGARDRVLSAAEGDGASGAALPFDGNETYDLACWLVPNEDWNEETFFESTLPKLMYFTGLGHLAWVLLPPKGFRL